MSNSKEITAQQQTGILKVILFGANFRSSTVTFLRQSKVEIKTQETEEKSHTTQPRKKYVMRKLHQRTELWQ